MNFSPAADSPLAAGALYSNNGTPFSNIVAYAAYEPDAGYTYPDLNSPFLAYDTTVRGWLNGPIRQRDYRVIIPSFFRPQLFPLRRGTNRNPFGANPSGTNPNGFGESVHCSDRRLGRCCVRTLCILSGPNQIRTARRSASSRGTSRPVDPNWNGTIGGVAAQSGDTNRISNRFRSSSTSTATATPTRWGSGRIRCRGRCSRSTAGSSTTNSTSMPTATACGTRSGWIWTIRSWQLDDGRQFVPMFAVKMVDADGLLNVNAHGNDNGLYARLRDGSIDVIGPDNFRRALSRSSARCRGAARWGWRNWTAVRRGASEPTSIQSNLGLSRSEVNLSLALTANLRFAGTNRGVTPHVDPNAANVQGVLDNSDAIASQFECRRTTDTIRRRLTRRGR